MNVTQWQQGLASRGLPARALVLFCPSSQLDCWSVTYIQYIICKFSLNPFIIFSKKRTVNEEHHVVQEKWNILYFFAAVNGKPTNIAVAKEYNIDRHYTSTHASKYDEYSGKLRERKVRELEQSLKKQQSLFQRVHQASDAAVRASYRIAQKIAVSSKPFSKENFIKKCMLLAVEDICPEKRQAFANISLSRNSFR